MARRKQKPQPLYNVVDRPPEKIDPARILVEYERGEELCRIARKYGCSQYALEKLLIQSFGEERVEMAHIAHHEAAIEYSIDEIHTCKQKDQSVELQAYSKILDTRIWQAKTRVKRYREATQTIGAGSGPSLIIQIAGMQGAELTFGRQPQVIDASPQPPAAHQNIDLAISQT